MSNMIDVNGPVLIDRVKKILTDPRREWPIIAAEPTTTEKLYSSYIVPLAAIPAIANFIGTSIIGLSLPFVGAYRVGIISGLTNAFVTYVLTLAMVYVAAIIVDKLAPTFDSTPNQTQALKLVAYSYTAAWVASVFNAIPLLFLIAFLGGLYTIYLFYVGLPFTMKTPESKVIPYMVVSAVAVICLSFLVILFTGVLMGIVGATVY
jgi:hypothetical protein